MSQVLAQGLSTVVLPSIEGIGFHFSNRYSRSLQVGGHEQKLLCSIDHITRTYIFMKTSADNMKGLFGEGFAKRFSYLGLASWGVVPLLHTLSNKLEGSEYKRLKTAVDFFYFRIPDLIHVASIVQSAASIYFGLYTVQNSIALSFYMLSFLEQGITVTKSVENQGLLFKIFDGNIVRFYNKPLQSIAHYVAIPYRAIYGGISGIFDATLLSLLQAPKSVRSYLVPQKIKDLVNQTVAKINLQMPKVYPTPQQASQKWKTGLYYGKYGVTEKAFSVFEMKDFFPATSFKNLEAQAIAKLEKATLSAENRQILEELIGAKNKKGLLSKHLSGAYSNEEYKKTEMLLKNLFGALESHWEDLSSVLVSRYDQFLCYSAITETLQDICLEIYPTLRNEKEAAIPQNELGRLTTRIDSKIQLILQQERDLLFIKNKQAQFETLKKRVASNDNELDKVLRKQTNSLKAKIKEFHLTSKGWYVDVIDEIKNWAFLNLAANAQCLSTSRHQVNFFRAIASDRGLGLSGEEEAIRDFSTKLAGGLGPSADVLRDVNFIQATIEEFHFKNTYLMGEVWFDELKESIINPFDKRISLQEVNDYLREVAKNSSNDLEADMLDRALLEIPDPETDPELYSIKVNLLVSRYLPVVLRNLGYVVEGDSRSPAQKTV